MFYNIYFFLLRLIFFHFFASEQFSIVWKMSEKVNFGLHSTKIKQLSDIISQDIMLGKYKTDTSLPSINHLSKTYNVSRDTVFKAFLELREKGLIDSTPGKGYYVINRQKTILLLLDEYSAFKNTLYISFIKKLSQSYKVDLWFHQYNERIFNTIMKDAIGRYNYYVVMNFDNERFSPILNRISPSRLLLLDFGKFDKKNYSYICQNFDDAFYDALSKLSDRLKKYRKIVFLLPDSSKHPKSSIDSFKNFCYDNDIISEVVHDEEIGKIERDVVYIVIKQTDVVDIIKQSRMLNMVCGKDFGLIAYNETPAYEVIDVGITSLSVDWKSMGIKAAKFIMDGESVQEFLPTRVHIRNSV